MAWLLEVGYSQIFYFFVLIEIFKELEKFARFEGDEAMGAPPGALV